MDVQRCFEQTTGIHEDAVFMAIEQNNLGALGRLIEIGIDLETVSAREKFAGWNPLLWAAHNENLQAMRLLVDAGVDVDATRGDWGCESPLSLAVYHGNPDAMRLLMESGADVNACANPTPEYLHGINPEKDGNPPYSPYQFWESIAGYRSAYSTTSRATVLHYLVTLARDGYMDQRNVMGTEIQLLLANGDIVLSRDDEGLTPLHYAALSSQATVNNITIRSLLDAGADVNATDNRGRTPLHEAYEERDSTGSARILLNAGADVNIADVEGRTPLHELGSLETIRVLLDAGADPSAVDSEGRTPLHLLIAGVAGADNKWARSSLFELRCYQISEDSLTRQMNEYLSRELGSNCGADVIQASVLLIDAGADIEIPDHAGRTPLDLAAKYNDLKEWLKFTAEAVPVFRNNTPIPASPSTRIDLREEVNRYVTTRCLREHVSTAFQELDRKNRELMIQTIAAMTEKFEAQMESEIINMVRRFNRPGRMRIYETFKNFCVQETARYSR